MVSPVETEGSDATESFNFVGAFTCRVSPVKAFTYASRDDFADPTGGGFEGQFLSRRGPEGWSTQAITPLREAKLLEQIPSYVTTAFTPELTKGIASTTAKLTSEAPVVPYGGLALYVADFDGPSPYRYVAPEYFTLGTSTDLSHVVFGGSEWMEGKVFPVTVGNQGETLGGIGSSTKNVWHAVSSDGSRVFFSNANVYVRVNTEQPQSPMETNAKSEEVCANSADACTVEVSASQRLLPNPAGAQPARYQGASADGSRVFFTSKAELTEDAYTGTAGQGANLYEYELAQEGKPARLTDLTGEATDKTGNGAAVQGVVQISEDGSYVYYVADGKLVEGAQTGKPNLYVSHDGAAPTFIATLLAPNDESDWTGEHEGNPELNAAVVTSDGTRLAFMSYNELTGYDNQDANTGQPDEEIYLYDTATSSLACASCNPSGARPTGSSTLPGAHSLGDAGMPLYRPRDLIEDGMLFFNSSDALVPHASDGRKNVYEYEDGHVFAISDVAGGYESFFMDASADGNNVFFATADQLLPEDQSNNVVVYDARVDGGFPVAPVAPSCDNADSCKPPVSPQPSVFSPVGSATFNGVGNVSSQSPPKEGITKKTAKCKKRLVKNKQGKCIRKKRAKKAKKSAHTNRRIH